jgi:5-methylcytosine-specific restriction enzyme subunit McrC
LEFAKNHITVFEHESLRIDRGVYRLTDIQLKALQLFYGEQGIPYYSLIHNGVKFNEYVGVIQVGDLIIEVLPKVDKSSHSKKEWQQALINMLRVVGLFNLKAPSKSTLSLKSNSILELYFELFINELEYLIRQGLIKKYRSVENNTTSLKGSLQFSKHLSKNIVHQERFYVRHSNYDKEHLLHQILYKTLKLLKNINRFIQLDSRINRLLFDFPELKDINVSSESFDKIHYCRKSIVYKEAINISEMLLLNYHPNIKKGQNDVLALMFDMNLLWEKFVYVCLRKFKKEDVSISAQNNKYFWKPNKGNRTSMIPDIVINQGEENCIVLDTKWKNLNGNNPSPDDLRQLYVYSKYYKAKKVALVYPGSSQTSIIKEGTYFDENSGEIGNEICSVISLPIEKNFDKWQRLIADVLFEWFGYDIHE